MVIKHGGQTIKCWFTQHVGSSTIYRLAGPFSLITALKLISNNLSEPTKTTDDNSSRSHNRSKLHFPSPAGRCPLRTSNPIEVPQEARENQSSSKSLDNQIDDYRIKQNNSYEEIKGSTGNRASKYHVPIISIDQQPARTVHSTTQPLRRRSENLSNRGNLRNKSKLKIGSSADTIGTNTVRDVSAPTTSENSPGSESTSAPNTSVLIGDSILKHIQSWKLGGQPGHRVVVKSFAGATTSDMSHYVKPTIAKNPYEILIHVGTDEVAKLTAAELNRGGLQYIV